MWETLPQSKLTRHLNVHPTSHVSFLKLFHGDKDDKNWKPKTKTKTLMTRNEFERYRERENLCSYNLEAKQEELEYLLSYFVEDKSCC